MHGCYTVDYPSIHQRKLSIKFPKRLLIKKTDSVATLTTNGFERREGIEIKLQDSYVLFLSSFRSILLSLTFEVVENQSWESDA